MLHNLLARGWPTPDRSSHNLPRRYKSTSILFLMCLRNCRKYAILSRYLTKKRPSCKGLDRVQHPWNPKFNVACAKLAMQRTEMKTPVFYKTVKAFLQHWTWGCRGCKFIISFCATKWAFCCQTPVVSFSGLLFARFRRFMCVCVHGFIVIEIRPGKLKAC